MLQLIVSLFSFGDKIYVKCLGRIYIGGLHAKKKFKVLKMFTKLARIVNVRTFFRARKALDG